MSKLLPKVAGRQAHTRETASEPFARPQELGTGVAGHQLRTGKHRTEKERQHHAHCHKSEVSAWPVETKKKYWRKQRQSHSHSHKLMPNNAVQRSNEAKW